MVYLKVTKKLKKTEFTRAEVKPLCPDGVAYQKINISTPNGEVLPQAGKGCHQYRFVMTNGKGEQPVRKINITKSAPAFNSAEFKHICPDGGSAVVDGKGEQSMKRKNILASICHSELVSESDNRNNFTKVRSRNKFGMTKNIKAAFTLAEVKNICPDWVAYKKFNLFAPIGEMSSKRTKGNNPLGANRNGFSRRVAFTLAEVLITLLIIGVVAALTLPTLMQNISDRKNLTKVAEFNSKFIQGLNLTKNAGEMGTQYSSTYDFLKNGLSNHLKMASICDSDHLKDCLGYDEIKYEDKNGNEKTEKVSSLKTAKSLNIKDSGFEDTASFIMGDGTPVLLTYNLNCMDDGGVDKSISSCVAGLFDINGSSQPNMFINKVTTLKNGKIKTEAHDIRSFNGAAIGGCIGYIDNLCIAASFIRNTESNWGSVVYDAIKNIDSKYSYPKFYAWGKQNNNNWKLASDYCEKVGGGRLPNTKELAQIGTYLYGIEIQPKHNIPSGITMKNKDIASSVLGIEIEGSNDYFNTWSSEMDGSIRAYRGTFYNTGISLNSGTLDWTMGTLCVK